MTDHSGVLLQERKRVVEFGLEMKDEDLANGTMGNVSVRDEDRFAVSPSGVSYEEITEEMVPVVSLDGEQLRGDLEPSSETPMHKTIYQARDDVTSVIHTHSPYASTFASLDQPIPASHYLLAFAGRDVPVTDYASPGTEALGRMAADTMGTERDAVLLKNHGVITVGETPEDAFEVAMMLEYCARIHYQANAIGEPEILDDEQVDHLRDMFSNDYGQNS